MPNGRAHSVATVVTTITAGVMAYALAGHAEFAGWVAAGSALTLLVNPDTDQEGMDRNEHRLVRNTLGCGFVWLALWYPYAVMFRHRGLSHVPIIGTLTRLGYMAAIVTALASAWYVVYPFSVAVDREWAIMAACGTIAGMMASDVVHWLMDGM